jgi:glycosyltransferase involved in cell wall biosynthesis
MKFRRTFGFPKVLFNRLVLRQCLRAADGIACVSRSTWTQLERIAPKLAHRKGTVVANCVEPVPTISAHPESPSWSGRPFLLCIAQHRRNKNILFLLRIFEHLLRSQQISSGMRLVIVGIEGPETKAILRFLNQASFADRVILLSGISEEELRWSYANCELLLAPSSVEGFGLPVAEALLAGCPVICSDIPAFREVGGDHCLYIPLDADAERSFAEAIPDSLRQGRSARGPVFPLGPINLPQLSAPVIAAAYLQLYESLLSIAENACLPLSTIQNCETDSIL